LLWFVVVVVVGGGEVGVVVEVEVIVEVVVVNTVVVVVVVVVVKVIALVLRVTPFSHTAKHHCAFTIPRTLFFLNYPTGRIGAPSWPCLGRPSRVGGAECVCMYSVGRVKPE